MATGSHSIASVSTVEQISFLSIAPNIGEHDESTTPAIICTSPHDSSCESKHATDVMYIFQLSETSILDLTKSGES